MRLQRFAEGHERARVSLRVVFGVVEDIVQQVEHMKPLTLARRSGIGCWFLPIWVVERLGQCDKKLAQSTGSVRRRHHVLKEPILAILIAQTAGFSINVSTGNTTGQN